jgi:YVTN family beta-propeller protein
MSVQKLFVAAVAGVVVVACSATPTGAARSSGSLAVSNDQQFLYAADTDSNQLFVLDARSLEFKSAIKVGASPFRVVVGADDTVYVANRAGRSVSVIHKGTWSEAAKIPTGIEPNGMQVSDDGKTLYVVSATKLDDSTHGMLQAFDTATLQNTWSTDLGEEPRGLALVAGNRAVVSLYKQGDVQLIDLAGHTVVQASTDIYQAANRSALSSTLTVTGPADAPVTFHARGIADVAATPDGKKLFVPSQLSREAPILTPPSATVPYYQSEGPRLAGSVSTPAVFTFDSSGDGLVSQVEDVSNTTYGYTYGSTQPTDQGFPQTSYAVSGYGSATILQGPSVAVVDMTGQWLFMVNRESSNLAVISATTRNAHPDQSQGNTNGTYSYYGNETPSVHSTATIGAGADGIAILGDNQTAYVYSQFDHTITTVVCPQGAAAVQVQSVSPALTSDTLDPTVVAGRKLFFDANNREVSAITASVSCASCHLEGRDDGHTWQFPDGPRQTPTLAGRGIPDTAPYHWSGEFATIDDFMTNVVTERMGGTGLTGSEPQNLFAYMGALSPPENPYVGAAPTTAQLHGAQLFQSAGCSTCHLGQWLTDNKNHQVGSLNTAVYNPDNGIVMTNGFNTPSLKGLARSAPYLHDGSAATIFDRVNDDHSGAHGTSGSLSGPDKTDLVEYLKTL